MNILIRWIAGLLTGAAWSIINFLTIIKILKIALLKKDKAKLFVMLLVKFPVLYLLGFLILICGIFPVSSLLLGGFLVLAVVGVIRLCQRRI